VSSELKHSPLHDRHLALRAKMADFGGWEMPIEYPGGGVIAEHTAVRERVGVFDVSHLGKGSVRGPGARDYLNTCLTNDLDRIAPGHAQYTLCCDETGGVVDDLIAYVNGPDEVFLMPNAANTGAVMGRLSAAAPSDIVVTDEHTTYGVLAVQGPQSPAVLTDLGLPADLSYMQYTVAEFRAQWWSSAVPATPASGVSSCCRDLRPHPDCGTRCLESAAATWGSAVRAGGEGHVAHRDGLSAARARTVRRHLAGAGTRRLGGGLEQAGVLGPRRAAAREGERAVEVVAGSAQRRSRNSACRHDRRGGRRHRPSAW
jgi:hypothetical protein